MHTRFSQIRWVLFVTLLANLLVAAGKLLIGFSIGALSMIADGFHSLMDSTSNVVGLIGIHMSQKPPDNEHPYGHRKFETLASMGISFLLAFTAFEIIQNAIRRFAHPAEIERNPLAIVVLIASMGISYLVSVYEGRKGRQLRSEILIADSYHTRSDFYGAFLVLIALVSSWVGLAWADPLASLLIVLLIFRAAYGIVRDAISSLSDAARIDVESLQRYVNGIAGVEQCHKVRTRGVAEEIYMDMHVRVDPQMQVEQLHHLEHSVVGMIRERFPEVRDVMVHFEPFKKE